MKVLKGLLFFVSFLFATAIQASTDVTVKSLDYDEQNHEIIADIEYFGFQNQEFQILHENYYRHRIVLKSEDPLVKRTNKKLQRKVEKRESIERIKRATDLQNHGEYHRVEIRLPFEFTGYQAIFNVDGHDIELFDEKFFQGAQLKFQTDF